MTAAGVAVAAASLTVFLALGQGLRVAVQEQTDSVRPQLQVSIGGLLAAAAPPPTLPDSILPQIEAQRAALHLKHVTPVLLSRQQFGRLSVTLFGIPAAAGFNRVYPYARVQTGRQLFPTDEGRAVAVVGSEVARQANVRPGETLALLPGRAVRVVGVLSPTHSLTDAFVILPLHSAQIALRVPHLISLAAVEVEEGVNVLDVAAALEERVPAEVYAQQQARQATARLLSSAKVVQWSLAGVALLVAFLSVLTTMSMAGHERQQEIGVLRAVGLSPRLVLYLMTLEGGLLAVTGGLVGIVIGWATGVMVSAVTVQRLGVPVAILTGVDALVVLGVSTLVGSLAALPVAWRLSRQSIVSALRAS
ncbi:ABC transporter permease [Deinococcus apachensis]|uniref:ABC transporter permease n=1 Tax=Deinococcus apachensis TaxID=309886 RepID=UPI000A04DFE3|nr:ABC transporter permease [Deinococcus apachensis]